MAIIQKRVTTHSRATQADISAEKGAEEQVILLSQASQIADDENDYAACARWYAGVTEDNYIERNISTNEFNAIETERLRAALRILPKSAFEAAVVMELGSGYGRNWSLLREHFPQAIVC